MKEQDPRIPGLIPEQQNIPGLTPGSELRKGVKGSAIPRTAQNARENIGSGSQKNPRIAGLKMISNIMLFDIFLGIVVFLVLFFNLDDTGATGIRVGDWTPLMWGLLGLSAVATLGFLYFRKQVRALDEQSAY